MLQTQILHSNCHFKVNSNWNEYTYEQQQYNKCLSWARVLKRSCRVIKKKDVIMFQRYCITLISLYLSFARHQYHILYKQQSFQNSSTKLAVCKDHFWSVCSKCIQQMNLTLLPLSLSLSHSISLALHALPSLFPLLHSYFGCESVAPQRAKLCPL